MRKTIILIAALLLPGLAQAGADSKANRQARCSAAVDARTVAHKAADLAVSTFAARKGEKVSPEMTAIRALALAMQFESIAMVEARCKGLDRS